MCLVTLTCSCHRIMLQLHMCADHGFHLEGLFHIIHAGTHFAPLSPSSSPLPLTLSSPLCVFHTTPLPTFSLVLSCFLFASCTCRCVIPISPIAPCSRACMRLPTLAAKQGCPYITVASQGRPCITAANHRSRLASRSLSRSLSLSLSTPGRTVTPPAI